MAVLDRRSIFDRGWQLVAHVCQLQQAGDHVVADRAMRRTRREIAALPLPRLDLWPGRGAEIGTGDG
ncbi:MAG: hypothetical protein LC715_00890 [Gammaproteobacteria bacterium]|nr:hypothetical protein [Gammaproteobacteria bacterium]